MFNKIIDIFFPSFCIGCRKEGKYICDRCSLFLSEARLSCPECHKFNYNGKTHNKCRKDSSLDGLVSFWDHEFLIKSLISKAKDDGCFDILKKLVQESFQIMTNDKRYYPFLEFLISSDLITYIPASKRERRKRGFDTNEVIAREVGRISNINVIPLISRNGEHFIYNNSPFSKIVLVDDCWFSESEIINCAPSLKKMGVKRIYGYTLSKGS